MAKGNLIMGTARGKLGEVVFSRQNGQQVSRQYIRNQKNPKTQGQQIQRAVMATCAKMYGMGKEIFDHSFQGKGVPAGSMRQFIKVNLDKLRADVLRDIELQADPEECVARVVSPGALTAAPNRYIISQGSFKAAPFETINKITGAYGNWAGFKTFYESTITVKQLFEQFNIEANDVFTFVILSAEEDTMTRLVSPTTHFGTVRLIARDLDTTTAEKLVSAATIGEAFKVSSKGVSASAATTIAASKLWNDWNSGNPNYKRVSLFEYTDILPTGQTPAAIGYIASHVGSKERSSAEMELCVSQQNALIESWSVASIYLIEAWSAAASYAPSDLYLEGQGNAPSIIPENYVTLQTLGGGDVDIVGVKFVENDGVVLAKAVDVDGAEYYVQNTSRKSDYYGKALPKLYTESESAPALPADSDNNNTIGFDAQNAAVSLQNEAFAVFYNGGVDTNMCALYFLGL
jgi:hypothetical protein